MIGDREDQEPPLLGPFSSFSGQVREGAYSFLPSCHYASEKSLTTDAGSEFSCHLCF